MARERTLVSVSLSPEDKSDLDIITTLLGYSLSEYCAQAVNRQVQEDKAKFPKAFAAARAAQEEVRSQRSA